MKSIHVELPALEIAGKNVVGRVVFGLMVLVGLSAKLLPAHRHPESP